MGRTVPITMITTDRVIDAGDDLSELAKSIQEAGLAVPVLVGPDYELIDGLRRLEALRSLGETTVEVVATSLYPIACDLIDRARKHGVAARPLTGRRIWEIYQKMQPLLQVTKAHYARGKPKVGGHRISAGGRPILAQALGLASQSYLQAVTQLHRYLDDPTKAERAALAIELIEAGEMGYYGGIDFVKRPSGMPGHIRRLSEQSDLLGSATASLHGTIKALNQLGPLDPNLSREEVDGRISELALVRTRLNSFIKLLSEENNKR